MKKIICIAIVAAATGAIWLLWPQPAPLLPTAGTSVIVFGDSLAAGVGATANHDIASLLRQTLNQSVLNLGVPGDTTADGLARIDSLLQANPRVVIILLGGNDALRKIPTNETFNNLDQIIRKIQAAGAAVILVGEPGGFFGNQYEKEYERLATTHRTFYISNILSGLLGRSEYMSDLIHPNDAGYEIATGRILVELQKALEH